MHPRRRFKAQSVAVEGVAIGLLSGNAFERAAGIEDPAVVETAKEFGAGAFMFAANKVAAMPACVHQDADLAIIAMREDYRPTGYPARHEVARIREFRDMAREEPAFVENPGPFLLEDLLIDKDAAMDPKDAIRAIVEN
jgi:hypothetical protein